MQFVVLGSGTHVPDPRRGPAGFLVGTGDRWWLVDGGSGTIQRCAAAGVDPRGLAGGFYSHFHPDHCGDLAPLLFLMHSGATPRNVDYPIWAGAGFTSMFAGLQQAYGRWLYLGEGATTPITELPLDQGSVVDLGGLVARARPAVHSASALHWRFEADGKAVVFSGDTAPSDALVDLATNADLLVVECGGTDERPLRGHMTPRTIAELVLAARPREVWLTHLYPDVDPEAALAAIRPVGVPVRHAADLDRWVG